MIHLRFERKLWKQGLTCVAGVDEVGRGPLAGPVVAAAVMFPSEVWIRGIDDSKKLSEEKRETLYHRIIERAHCMGVGAVTHTVIDEVNILQATLRAMAEALGNLDQTPQHVLIDGRPVILDSSVPTTHIIDGDAKCFSIAAASIIAKVTRDRLMKGFDEKFPQYGFAKHKGYGTKEHLEALRKFGPCEIHRRSFLHALETSLNHE